MRSALSLCQEWIPYVESSRLEQSVSLTSRRHFTHLTMGHCRIMKSDVVPDKLVRLIRAYYTQTTTCVRTQLAETTSFGVDLSVPQGCPLSHTLFNHDVDCVSNNSISDFKLAELARSLTWSTTTMSQSSHPAVRRFNRQ